MNKFWEYFVLKFVYFATIIFIIAVLYLIYQKKEREIQDMALTENDVKVLTKALEYANKEEKKIIENILKNGFTK